MIDLHVHLLPFIDDGPATLEAALDMARCMVDVGIHTAASTPHARKEQGWDNRRHSIVDAVAAFSKELEAHRIDLKVLPAAEHYLDVNFFDLVDNDEVTPYALGKYLLVELSTIAVPPDLPASLYRLRRKGYEPVLAHVERYDGLLRNARLLDDLQAQGYAMQVDMGALIGLFGRAQKKASWSLLEAGQIAIVASDAHCAQDISKMVKEARHLLQRKLGADLVDVLLERNPQAILNGTALDVSR